MAVVTTANMQPDMLIKQWERTKIELNTHVDTISDILQSKTKEQCVVVLPISYESLEKTVKKATEIFENIIEINMQINKFTPLNKCGCDKGDRKLAPISAIEIVATVGATVMSYVVSQEEESSPSLRQTLFICAFTAALFSGIGKFLTRKYIKAEGRKFMYLRASHEDHIISNTNTLLSLLKKQYPNKIEEEDHQIELPSPDDLRAPPTLEMDARQLTPIYPNPPCKASMQTSPPTVDDNIMSIINILRQQLPSSTANQGTSYNTPFVVVFEETVTTHAQDDKSHFPKEEV